ncbi:MAG: ecdysteroid 22-kinase family protein, partial [Actinomycetota bacterium]|nr:ecdysteroid 22-kinase family protein [Actinomycetota bacterium]
MRPAAGSIPGLLGMFERELRFYREVAPTVGVRVPACYDAQETQSGYRLVLEDLSTWRDGADPVSVAALLAHLHRRWERRADARWPWLDRSVPAAADEIGRLYDEVWAMVSERPEVTPLLREVGETYVGQVAQLERSESEFGRPTLIHGDASWRNIRSSASGEIALVDWEDVRLATGELDLAWFLISSVAPPLWSDVIDAYAPTEADFEGVLPHALTQAILSFSDCEPESAPAYEWMDRLEEAAGRLR